jgi:hypothetical protein
MGLITGITGAAADPVITDPQVSPDTELAPTIATPMAAESVPSEPGPGLEERSFSLVGRAMRFVMKTVTPGAWQSVIQELAGQMPKTIELKPVPELRWGKEAKHLQFVEELRDQGFVEAGMYYASNMDTNLHLLVNEAYDIRAVVYEREDSGIVLDLVTLFGDGTGITYVNRDDPGYEQSPLHPNVYRGNVPVFELLDACLRERPQKATLPESPATAARLMELEYEFGAKRLRGEPVNPVEIADAYLEVIERFGIAPSPLKDAVEQIGLALPTVTEVPHPSESEFKHAEDKAVAAQTL